MNLVLIRHTKTSAPEGVCHGRTDYLPASTFLADARTVAEDLPWLPTTVWSSPLTRCLKLAQTLAEPGVQVRVDARLMELDFGLWEGRRWDDFRGPECDAWCADPVSNRPPHGESLAEMLARVAAVRAKIVASADSQTAVVTHAGVIRCWLHLSTGLPLDRVFAAPVPFGALMDAESFAM
jgi:alpha-ribazole phosphatase